MKWKYVVIGVAIFVIVALICAYIFVPPKIILKNEETNINEKYKPDYKVKRFGIDYTKKTKTKGKINTKKLGTYNLTFTTKIGLKYFKQIIKEEST